MARILAGPAAMATPFGTDTAGRCAADYGETSRAMFSPSQMDAALYEEVSSVLNAVHRAAFDETAPANGSPDPLLAVPVRLIPLVQTTRALRQELRAQTARSELLAAVLEALPDAVAVIDDARTLLFAN